MSNNPWDNKQDLYELGRKRQEAKKKASAEQDVLKAKQKAELAKKAASDAKQVNLNRQRQASGQTKASAVSVHNNVNKPFDAKKAAEFKAWQAQQTEQVVQPAQTPLIANTPNVTPTKFYNPKPTSIVQPVSQSMVNPVVQTKPISVVNVNKPTTKSISKPAETVSAMWQRITGTNWSEARNNGLTTGSLNDNLALMKRLRSGENPLEIMKQEQLTKKQALKAKAFELSKLNQKRMFDNSFSQQI